MNREEIYNFVAMQLQIPDEIRKNPDVQRFVNGCISMYVRQSIKEVSVTRKLDAEFMSSTIGDVDSYIKGSLSQQIGKYLFENGLLEFIEEQEDPFIKKYSAKLFILKPERKTNKQCMEQLMSVRTRLNKMILEETDENELEHLHNLLLENESQMNIFAENIESGKYYVGVDLAENGKDFTSIVELNGDGC